MNSIFSDLNLLTNGTSILITVFILVLTLVYYLWRKIRKSRKSVLLLGLGNSGKTALFSNLVCDNAKETFSSIRPNTGVYESNHKCIRIIDVPGNEKIRQKYFDQFKVDAHGVIYLIDSNVIQTYIRDIAEYLYVILTDTSIKSNCRQLLILCNKQDGSLAKTKVPVQHLLQKELDILRQTKTKQLDAVDSSASISILGDINTPFDFSQCKPINVSFAESVLYSEDCDEINLKEIEEWFSKLR